MLHKREPPVEVQKSIKNEKKDEDEVKNVEPEPPTISREEEIRRLREINANDLADELTNTQNVANEDEHCAKCKKNPSRKCRECGCQVST